MKSRIESVKVKSKSFQLVNYNASFKVIYHKFIYLKIY